MPKKPAVIDVLRHREYRALLIGGMASTAGGMVHLVAAAWLMTGLTQSEQLVALVQSSVSLPTMLLALAVGVLVDNYDRRRILIVANAFMLAVTLLIAALAQFDLLTPWLLLALSFVVGAGAALHFPSWQVSTSSVVGREFVPVAVATNAAGFAATRSTAPALGGIVLAATSAASTFFLAAAFFLTMTVFAFRWRVTPPERPLPREPFGAAYMTGLRFLLTSPDLLATVLRTFIIAILGISVQALLPVVVRVGLHGEAYAYGALLGCFGVGSIIGAIYNVSLRDRFSNEAIVRVGTLGYAASVALLAASTHVALTGLVLVVSGAGWIIVFSLLNANTQLSSPRWVTGRMLAIYHTAVFGGMAIGSILWGTVAEALGTATALYVSAAALALLGVFPLLPRLSEQDSRDLSPAGSFRAPETHLELTPSSGPVVIMVEYAIPPQKTDEFLAAIAEYRRIRIRAGARHWTLTRDIADPDTWIESYRTATWTEYLRHHERHTKADASVLDRLKAMQKNGAPLKVRRMVERPARPTDTGKAPPGVMPTVQGP